MANNPSPAASKIRSAYWKWLTFEYQKDVVMPAASKSRRGKGKDEHSEDIEFVPRPCYGAADRESECADEIEDCEQEGDDDIFFKWQGIRRAEPRPGTRGTRRPRQTPAARTPKPTRRRSC